MAAEIKFPVSSARMWPVLNPWLLLKWESGYVSLNSGLYLGEDDSPSKGGSGGPTWASFLDGCKAKMLKVFWWRQRPVRSRVYRMRTWKSYQFECKLQIWVSLKLHVTNTWRCLLEKTWLFELLDYSIKTASLVGCCSGIGQITAYF